MASLPGVFNLQEFTNSGDPAALYRLYTYAPGTTTHKAIYTDPAGTIPHSYISDGIGGLYIALDARGELPAPPFCAAGGYDFVVKTDAGGFVRSARRVIGSEDSGAAAVSTLRADLASATDAAKGGALVGLGGLSYTAKTIGAAIVDGAVNIMWLVTNEAQRAAIKAKTYADDHTSLLSAALTFANGRPVYLPAGGYKISAATLNDAGQIIFGDGWGNTIIRASDPTLHLFTVVADNVTLRDIELHGAATVATTSRFAVFTDTATPATGLKLDRVKISGQTASHGFTNGVKYDDSCNDGRVSNCWIDRLIGTASGFGYGVLTGNVTNVHVTGSCLYGSAGRGRHGIYFSGGASWCVAAYNVVDGFVLDGITQFSQGVQPPCEDNLYAFNVVNACASVANPANAAISIAGHSLRAKVLCNTVTNSMSCGIKLEGTGFIDLKDTTISGNDIASAAMIGVDLVSAVGGSLSNNTIKDSSSSSAGTYSNVRFICGAASVATSGFLVAANHIPASTVARSGIQTNTSPPVPVGLRFDGNKVGAGTVADYEFLGLVFTVDGLRKSRTVFNWPAIANGASFMQTFSPAEFSDLPADSNLEATYTGNTDGMIFEVQCLVAGTARVTLANFSGASKTATGGSVVLTWTGAI